MEGLSHGSQDLLRLELNGFVHEVFMEERLAPNVRCKGVVDLDNIGCDRLFFGILRLLRNLIVILFLNEWSDLKGIRGGIHKFLADRIILLHVADIGGAAGHSWHLSWDSWLLLESLWNFDRWKRHRWGCVGVDLNLGDA